jgi:hypothetical protein
MLGQMILSTAWVDLIAGAKYYAGSYARSSRFTTRIHTVFESHARPDEQTIIDVVRLFPNPDVDNSSVSTELRLSLVDRLPHSRVTSTLLTKLLDRTNPICEPIHGSEYYEVLDSKQRSIAYVIKHDSINECTAANVFQYIWLLPLDGIAGVSEIVDFLRGQSNFSKRTIQVVIPFEHSTAVQTSTEHQVPAFWTVTHKDDLGPLVGSMYRAVYAVLRKYGEDGVTEIASTFR